MKPCPNLPKGEQCPLCGGKYICLDWKRKSSSRMVATPAVGFAFLSMPETVPIEEYRRVVARCIELGEKIAFGVEPCPRGADKPEPTCTNRHQCWEPCGELGKSEEHASPPSVEAKTDHCPKGLKQPGTSDEHENKS